MGSAGLEFILEEADFSKAFSWPATKALTAVGLPVLALGAAEKNWAKRFVIFGVEDRLLTGRSVMIASKEAEDHSHPSRFAPWTRFVAI